MGYDYLGSGIGHFGQDRGPVRDGHYVSCCGALSVGPFRLSGNF